MADLKFPSILPRKVPVEIGDKTYTLTEPSSAVSSRFKEAMAKCSKNVKGNTVISNAEGMVTANMELVSQCLRDPEGKNVPAQEIREWPSSMVEAILGETLALCGFIERDEEDLKNG